MEPALWGIFEACPERRKGEGLDEWIGEGQKIHGDQTKLPRLGFSVRLIKPFQVGIPGGAPLQQAITLPLGSPTCRLVSNKDSTDEAKVARLPVVFWRHVAVESDRPLVQAIQS